MGGSMAAYLLGASLSLLIAYAAGYRRGKKEMLLIFREHNHYICDKKLSELIIFEEEKLSGKI